MQWWREVPLPWIEALHSFAPVLDAEDAIARVNALIVGSGRLSESAFRNAIGGWQETIRASAMASAPTPQYSHTIEDQAARFAAMGIAVRVFA